MPVIEQEHGIKRIKGLPDRWGRRAYAELSAALKGAGGAQSDRYKALARMLDDVTDAPLPLEATDAQLCILAERYANECITLKTRISDPDELRARMLFKCGQLRITPPSAKLGHDEAVARCCDPAWWRRSLRKVHGRAFEAAAIRLGFVSVREGAYASNETVARRLGQVARNKAALESVKIRNEKGDELTLAEAASKGTSNKRIRRGELMLRLSGCEEIANELGHVGVFFTLTAPSKYHAVLQKSGVINKNYKDFSPRDVAAYLQKTWGLIRSAYGKLGIKPYGFRIAEPHHDGCVHWHGLVFMRPCEIDWFECLFEKYGLAVDGDEPGAQENRVKFERIDPAKGSAAAYIAKYISKNIDDDSEDAHDEVVGEDGAVQKFAIVNDSVKRASQRVDAWAGVWGIRQFQPIGQPPVTVWRELRRVPAGEVSNACDTVRAAWDAAQRVYSAADKETGEVELIHAANYAEYIRAQGGVCVGRDYAIAIKKEDRQINGRYGVRMGEAPTGIYAKASPEREYVSTRYTWERVQSGVAVRRSWSPVNNCTDGTADDSFFGPAVPLENEFGPCRMTWFRHMPGELVAAFDDEWFKSDEYQKFLASPLEVEGHLIAATIYAYEISDERKVRDDKRRSGGA